MHSKIHQINRYLKFPGVKYCLNTGMLLSNAPNYTIIKSVHIMNDPKHHSMQALT